MLSIAWIVRYEFQIHSFLADTFSTASTPKQKLGALDYVRHFATAGSPARI